MKHRWASISSLIVTVLLLAAWTTLSATADPKKENTVEVKKIYMETGLMLRKAVMVQASPDEAYDAWATEAGVKTFLAPDARIDMAINGAYEIYFDKKQKKGSRGSEGCRILSFIPGEMLSFTWNNPPSLPGIRTEHTWVVVTFKAVGEKQTRVDLIHLGWRAGEEWQKALKYFDRAWQIVLGRFQYRFQKEPINWKKPFTPEITGK